MKTLTNIVRRPALVLTVMAAGACNGSDGPSGPPFEPGDLVYRLQANRIFYDFVDTTAGLDIRLRWLSDTTFSGLNCLGFRPLSLGADTGTFQFFFAGTNEGLIEQSVSGVLDTVIGVFLSGQEGTHGAYKISATDDLTLYWADAGADLTRYFDPNADIRFVHPDTLRSSADLRFQGDSIRAQWDVRWVARQCAL